MKQFDVVVIGAGPGGYVAAIRAAQLGRSVACVDRFKAFGGTCLRVGCIPSKALLESSHHFELLQHGLADHGIKVRKAQLDLGQMLRRKDQIVERLTGGVHSLLKKNKVEVVVGHARLAAAAGSRRRRADDYRISPARSPGEMEAVVRRELFPLPLLKAPPSVVQVFLAHGIVAKADRIAFLEPVGNG